MNLVKKQKKIPYSTIATLIGMEKKKMENIRSGKSSASSEHVEALDECFPDLFGAKEKTTATVPKDKYEELKQELDATNREVARLKDSINELYRTVNRLLIERVDELKEQKMID